MPALLMSRPSAAFISDVSSRSWRPPIISGFASIASRTIVSAGAIERTRVPRPDGRGRPGTRTPGRPREAGTRRSRRRSHRSPSRSRSGVVPYARATAARYATCDGCSGCQYVSRSQPFSRDSSSETACCPEHMWRIGPGFSPSRARRAAVSGSSGIPSLPQASSAWLTPARRNMPWSVRTWKSSPEWELAMIAISGGSRSNASIPPASMSATTPNGLTVERRVTTRSGSPSRRISRPVDVRLDDVAAVDALLDAVAELADEDGRVRSRSVTGPCPTVPGRALRGKGHIAEHTAHGEPRRVVYSTRWGSMVPVARGPYARRTGSTTTGTVCAMSTDRVPRMLGVGAAMLAAVLAAGCLPAPSATSPAVPASSPSQGCAVVGQAIGVAARIHRRDRRVRRAGDERQADVSRGVRRLRPRVDQPAADRRRVGRVRGRLLELVHVRLQPRLHERRQDPRPGPRGPRPWIRQVGCGRVADDQELRCRVSRTSCSRTSRHRAT